MPRSLTQYPGSHSIKSGSCSENLLANPNHQIPENMKTPAKPLAFLGILLTLFCASTLPAQNNIGQWDFDHTNLTATAGATLGDLQYADGPSGATATATQFGSTAVFGIPAIDGTNAQVMKFPGGHLPEGFLMPTPPPNDGGSLLNDYTIIFD